MKRIVLIIAMAAGMCAAVQAQTSTLSGALRGVPDGARLVQKRIDANGKPFWTMTGRFVCNNPDRDTDEYCLSNGYVSVVPVSPDFTCYQHIPNIKNLEL